jgi:hypothetical protein
MRTIGQRETRPITFSASSDLLAEGARFNDEMQRLSGEWSCIPKGVYRFRTHEEANRFDLDCLARKIAKISKERP